MPTTTGGNSALIVVDDPTGCVVPSPGVQIIGKNARISFMPQGENRYYDLGEAVMLKAPAMGKTLAVNHIVQAMGSDLMLEGLADMRKQVEPRNPNSFRAKPKRLHKGLRP